MTIKQEKKSVRTWIPLHHHKSSFPLSPSLPTNHHLSMFLQMIRFKYDPPHPSFSNGLLDYFANDLDWCALLSISNVLIPFAQYTKNSLLYSPFDWLVLTTDSQDSCWLERRNCPRSTTVYLKTPRDSSASCRYHKVLSRKILWADEIQSGVKMICLFILRIDRLIKSYSQSWRWMKLKKDRDTRIHTGKDTEIIKCGE